MAKKRAATRREFLTGRAAARAAEGLADQAGGTEEDHPTAPLAGSPAPGGSKSQSFLTSFTRDAMACEFAIYLTAGEYPQAAEAALAALDQVERLEDQLTVYREESEIQEINRTAGENEVEVEPGLFGLLRLACNLHRQTDGAFDITSGPLSKAWGFSRRNGRKPTGEEIAEALARIDGSQIALDDEHQTVCFLQPDVEINVNAIGKGYALDESAQLLKEHGVDNFLFHGGQSSVLASGSPSGSSEHESATQEGESSERGWSVGLRHPMRPDRRLAEFYLKDEALGTSGSGTQFFHFQGKRYGHILDPRTGEPASGVYSATVLAPTAAEADALATAFYVLGVEATEAFCQSRPELGAALVVPGARAGAVGLFTFGLAEDRWRLLE